MTFAVCEEEKKESAVDEKKQGKRGIFDEGYGDFGGGDFGGGDSGHGWEDDHHHEHHHHVEKT